MGNYYCIYFPYCLFPTNVYETPLSPSTGIWITTNDKYGQEVLSLTSCTITVSWDIPWMYRECYSSWTGEPHRPGMEGDHTAAVSSITVSIHIASLSTALPQCRRTCWVTITVYSCFPWYILSLLSLHGTLFPYLCACRAGKRQCTSSVRGAHVPTPVKSQFLIHQIGPTCSESAS